MELPITGNRVRVKVRPSAKRTEITRIGEYVHVNIAAPAERGKANAELERFLTRITGRTATVIGGRTSSRKTVRLS